MENALTVEDNTVTAASLAVPLLLRRENSYRLVHPTFSYPAAMVQM